jgi:ubiquinone/menaquinone biosynthesis C-methylase UbiE
VADTSLVAAHSCLICRTTRMRPAIYAGAAFLLCPRCGFASLVADRKRVDYWEDPAEAAAQSSFWISGRQKYFRSALALLATLAPGRRLLDIGGGIGYFAEAAISEGWDACTVDISPIATKLAIDRLGDHHVVEQLADISDGSFDMVTMWCVLAHVDDPWRLLGEVRRVLKPAGVLWATTPNFRFQARYAQLRQALRRPLDFARQDHYLHFTERSLAQLLQSSWFESVQFHNVGIMERCLLFQQQLPVFAPLKQTWNRLASGAHTLGLPSYTSELQVTARAC